MSEVTFPAATFVVRRAIEQPASGTTDAQLREAAKTFETVYLSEMLTNMGVAVSPKRSAVALAPRPFSRC
jgi:Rod binding domain-containing protein